MQLDLTQKINKEATDIGVKYTHMVLESLRRKVKESNATSEKQVNLNQLKLIFVEGARESESPILSGLARVNMFIRLYCSSSMVKEFSACKVKVSKSTLIDFSNYLSPNEEDLLCAGKDVELFKDNQEYKKITSIEELYLDDSACAAHYLEYL